MTECKGQGSSVCAWCTHACAGGAIRLERLRDEGRGPHTAQALALTSAELLSAAHDTEDCSAAPRTADQLTLAAPWQWC